jgi:hypothetical protein
MDDSLDAIQYQYDRANMIISTQQTVEWSKNGIRMGSTMLETLARKFGITLIDGFSSNLCKDMNKFNQPLTKMVRKYWRKGSTSPEMELGMIVFSSLAMTVIANKGLGGKSEDSGSTASTSASKPNNGSILKPPQSFGVNEPSLNEIKPSSKIPEWARSAMNAPLPKIQHYAQVEKKEDSFPELSRHPLPVIPVLQTQQVVHHDTVVPKLVSPQVVPQVLPQAVTQVVPQVPPLVVQQSNNISTLMPTVHQHNFPVSQTYAATTSGAATSSSSVVVENNSKKIVLPSPRSSRRKRDTSTELILDM